MTRCAGRAAALFAGAVIMATPAVAGPKEHVQSGFDRFVQAQNAHDLEAVRTLLSSGPEFVWVTRGFVIKGRAAAIERFRELYRGTWKLQVNAPVETFVIDPNTVQLVAPVTFRIGVVGTNPADTRFILTQLWHRRHGHWQVVSILPIPVPEN